MRSLRDRNRKKRLVAAKLALLALAAGGLFIFLKARKEMIVRDTLSFFEAVVSEQTGLDVKIGKVGGDLLGTVTIDELRIGQPVDGVIDPLFECHRLTLKYSLLDFFAKDGKPGVQVKIDGARVRWNPHISLRMPKFPFMVWMRQWALKRNTRVAISADDAAFFYLPGRTRIEGISFSYENNRFRIALPMHHLELGQTDLSTSLNLEGEFDMALEEDYDTLRGKIVTEGTVVNWQPASHESTFDFVFSRQRIDIVSTSLVGDVRAGATVDFTSDYALDAWAAAENYALSNLDFLFGLTQGASLPGRASFDIKMKGDIWAPRIEGRARIYEGRIGRKFFSAMDINAEGVYPTVKLENSRVLLQDGTIMRFANQTLEMGELFKDSTYQALITDAQQDTVVWGDWEISRTQNESEQSDFLMQRNFGEHAKLKLKRSNEVRGMADYTGQKEEDPNRFEVGLELKLRPKDSLKFEVKEGEEFVGVERKMTF